MIGREIVSYEYSLLFNIGFVSLLNLKINAEVVQLRHSTLIAMNRILVVANFANSESETFDLTEAKYDISIPGKADVVLVTNSSMQWKPDDEISLRKIQLSAGHGFIAKWEFKRSL